MFTTRRQLKNSTSYGLPRFLMAWSSSWFGSLTALHSISKITVVRSDIV